jgi:hypothetical protein
VKPLTINAISTPRKTKKTANIVAAVAAKVKEDWRITCKDITYDHGGVKYDKVQHPLRLIRAKRGAVLSWKQFSGPGR